jgi:predicted nucleic acid-binding protein
MTRLFLDTNIVVDLLEGREPFCYDAAQLFTMAHDKRVELLVSPMTFSTASFLLRKHGSEGVRNLLSNLRQLVSVTISDERTVDDSIASQFKDFEDAMQYYTALNAKAEIIITRNGKDFTASNLPVMTATEYLANRIKK